MTGSILIAQVLGSSILLQQGGPGGAGCAGGGGSSMSFLVMMGAMFAIFYFLLIRPQQKRAKQHQELLKSLKKGDRVITNGGILGTVTGTSDKYLTIEISDRTRIRVLRSHVAGKEGDPEIESGNR